MLHGRTKFKSVATQIFTESAEIKFCLVAPRTFALRTPSRDLQIDPINLIDPIDPIDPISPVSIRFQHSLSSCKVLCSSCTQHLDIRFSCCSLARDLVNKSAT